ncbi:MAG: carbamoyl phosphate synthase small subunit [Gammaproteobacteria bacterium RIFCSPLOWO2_02_FULL_38_11]|nr:MAG: carbamoyl phosphate synthase small subunit [Gammaproteobacteria bacterium RIFCSPHIGHO2_02_FULL_38_33]OGT24587.1 MAG: carbamoyl phosphate synthase small subunit [Gammaproteobacteria bacterium RIFCSPHIGHO2_12_38_15]OGT69035.1 MAG: carbamoyl phosphate synthase small subunit [Gammaproteobacteria bacterium RIFCSPLOWO2_02_FULL_38_11]
MGKCVNPGVLVLADGLIFEGLSVGSLGAVCGEVVFNTAQTGYQEILTDPSYASQIITFTQPHIGNVGVNALDMESEHVFAKGVIMRSFSDITSNWRAQTSLKNFFEKQKLIAISEIDTRALTHHLREKGSQSACLMSGKINISEALRLAKNFPGLEGKDLAKEVTTSKNYSWNKKEEGAPCIVVYDFGVKYSILRMLSESDYSVIVVPATTSPEEVLSLHPKGIVLSNGPGDPAACDYAIKAIKIFLKKQIPLMGICLGHQLLALACGAQTKKMKRGHHGANHPVQCLKTKCVFISSQNHGFVVDEDSLPDNLYVTHRSLFDGTIAGIERQDLPAFGFQGHPESSPGPTELNNLFDRFFSLIKTHAKTN